MAKDKNSIVDRLVTKFNSSDVIKFSEKDGFSEIKSWAHTGSAILDYNLHTFGLPTGIVEIAGKSRSGKTTLGLVAMGNFLKENPDMVAVILSSENRDNKDYALQLGLPVERIVIVKIRYVEEMFMKVSSIVKELKEMYDEDKVKNAKFFFMWDSLGATLSKAEVDTMEENRSNMMKKAEKGEVLTDLKNEKMMAFAKSGKMFAKSMLGLMYNETIHFVILNHQYEQTVMGVSTKKSTGGEWVSLLPCMRLQLSLTGHEKIDDKEVAQTTEVKVIKNDFGSRAKTVVRILLGYGFILTEEEIEYCVRKNIIKKVSAKKFVFMDGKLQWSSKRELFNLYYQKNKFLQILLQKLKKVMQIELIQLKNSYKVSGK
jgi:RecA/RadA recombinase